jgi:hypothetical protein
MQRTEKARLLLQAAMGVSMWTRMAQRVAKHCAQYARCFGMCACSQATFGAAPSSASLTNSEGLIAAVSQLNTLHTANCTLVWTVVQRGRPPGRDRICLAIMWVSWRLHVLFRTTMQLLDACANPSQGGVHGGGS